MFKTNYEVTSGNDSLMNKKQPSPPVTSFGGNGVLWAHNI
jgi:hypothetical protein